MLADELLFPERRAEHIMAMPAAQRRWTAREVRQLIAENPLQTPRYELVDGELLVTPAPSWLHQRAVHRLWRALDAYLQANPVGEACTSPFDVELEPQTIAQPDLFVLSIDEARRLLVELPARELLLAIEVLSPSSGGIDKGKKRFLYNRRVPEYWIVDVDSRLLERWYQNDSRPEIIVESLRWDPTGAAEPFRLDLRSYFADVHGD